MSIFKAFFGLGKIPKVTKFFEFKSFDDVNQMGGAIANIKQQVKEGGLQLTNAQQKFLDDQMKQVEMVFELISKSPQSGIRNTESAKVFNLSGQRLDPNQPIIGGTQPGKKIDQDTFRRLAETNTQRIKQKIADKKVETEEEILARIQKENKESAERLREKKDIKDPEDMATGGRAGFKDGPDRPKFDFAATGSKSGRQQIDKAPEGITRDQETFQAIMNADIPLNDKLNFLANLQYSKDRIRIDKDKDELVLFEGGSKNREFGLGYNEGEEGLSGRVMYNLDTNEPEFKMFFKGSALTAKISYEAEILEVGDTNMLLYLDLTNVLTITDES
jgi:hypothetical protein